MEGTIVGAGDLTRFSRPLPLPRAVAARKLRPSVTAFPKRGPGITATMAESERLTDVFFNQPCPVCGRMLNIRVQLLGRRVYCQHCGGGFTAIGESLGRPPASDRVDELLARAERALEQAAWSDSDDQGVTA